MDEREWLACEDPGRLLDAIQPTRSGDVPPVELEGGRGGSSDRKLRLFACAAWRAYRAHWLTAGIDHAALLDAITAGIDHAALLDAITAAEGFADGQGDAPAATIWPLDGPGYACAVKTIRRIGGSALARQVMASLLRDIVGNPFRPTPPLWRDEACDECGGEGRYDLVYGVEACHLCDGVGRVSRGPSWLTPQVLDLARAAYEQRGRECGRCRGRGRISMADATLYERASVVDCPDCHGTGRIDDGTLDPHRLAVLADALEEAGCTEEALLRHLRQPSHVHGPQCGDRDGLWCAWESVTHVRGCWALDLVLGKS